MAEDPEVRCGLTTSRVSMRLKSSLSMKEFMTISQILLEYCEKLESHVSV